MGKWGLSNLLLGGRETLLHNRVLRAKLRQSNWILDNLLLNGQGNVICIHNRRQWDLAKIGDGSTVRDTIDSSVMRRSVYRCNSRCWEIMAAKPIKADSSSERTVTHMGSGSSKTMVGSSVIIHSPQLSWEKMSNGFLCTTTCGLTVSYKSLPSDNDLDTQSIWHWHYAYFGGNVKCTYMEDLFLGVPSSKMILPRECIRLHQENICILYGGWGSMHEKILFLRVTYLGIVHDSSAGVLKHDKY